MTDLRTDPELKPRTAEKALAPQPIQIQFDYGNSVYVFLCVAPLLFLETASAHHGAWVLVVWVLWTYASNWYSHIRLTRVVPFTLAWLDDATNYMFVIPVALLAAASASWAEQLGWMSLNPNERWAPYVAFALALGLHWSLLPVAKALGDLPDRATPGSYYDAAAELKYSWFNCNPIHVLRSHFLVELDAEGFEKDREPIVYFQKGKEYLLDSSVAIPSVRTGFDFKAGLQEARSAVLDLTDGLEMELLGEGEDATPRERAGLLKETSYS